MGSETAGLCSLDDIRRYQVDLLEDRRLGVKTVVGHVAALRFLYVKTLKRREMKEDLPYPKYHERLPMVRRRKSSI